MPKASFCAKIADFDSKTAPSPNCIIVANAYVAGTNGPSGTPAPTAVVLYTDANNYPAVGNGLARSVL